MIAGIGHNRGPVCEGATWRATCWSHARKQLLGPRLPVEVVRMRIVRARALGLDYQTYAGVRSMTGRDLIAFLFSSNALGVFCDGQALDHVRQSKLAGVTADRHLGCAPRLDAVLLGARIGASSARRLPVFGTAWAAMRDDMKSWLRAQTLPGDAVLMIGETEHERELMAAGGLAGFISGHDYFERQQNAL